MIVQYSYVVNWKLILLFQIKWNSDFFLKIFSDFLFGDYGEFINFKDILNGN
jgi:hypothetical protein